MPSSSIMSKYASARRAQGYKPYSSYASKYHNKLRAAVLRRKGFVPSLALTRSAELKHWESVNNTFNCSIAGQVDGVTTGIQVGTTDVTRIGKNIIVKKIHLSGVYRINSVAGAITPNASRVLIVYDTQQNGASVATMPVLVPSTAGDSVFSVYNPDYLSRFRILYDRVLKLDINGQGTSITPFSCDLNVNLPVEYLSVAGATVPMGSVSAMFFEYKTHANPNAWDYTFRVGFTDQ